MADKSKTFTAEDNKPTWTDLNNLKDDIQTAGQDRNLAVQSLLNAFDLQDANGVTYLLRSTRFSYSRVNGSSNTGRINGGATGDLSVAGAGKVITVLPMPWGLKVGRSVYISGGTGTAEVAEITALSGSGGDASGTVTVTTAQTHTGAWAVTSPYAGIQEAVDTAAVSGGVVIIPAGTHNLRATLTIPWAVRIRGEGMTGLGGVAAQSTTLQSYVDGIAVLISNGAGNPARGSGIHDLDIKAAGDAITSVNAIGLQLLNPQYCVVRHLTIQGFQEGTACKIVCDTTYGAQNRFVHNILWDNKFGYIFAGVAAGADNYSMIVGGAVIGHVSSPAAGSIGVQIGEYENGTIIIGLDVESCVTGFDISGDSVQLIATRTEYITGTPIQINAAAQDTRIIGHVPFDVGTPISDSGLDTVVEGKNSRLLLRYGGPILDNNINIYVKDSGGTSRSALILTDANLFGIGMPNSVGGGNWPRGSWNFADGAVRFNVPATVASAATLLLPSGNVFHVSGTTGITAIAAAAGTPEANYGMQGWRVTLIFDDVLTVTDGGLLKLAGDYTTSAGDTLDIVNDGTSWYEISRSAN